MNSIRLKQLITGVFAGVVGGIIGGLFCKIISSYGYYSGIMPGAAVGLAFSTVCRSGGWLYAGVSGLMGLVAGLLVQWLVYSNSPTFFEFLIDFPTFGWLAWVSIGCGAVIAFFLVRPRDLRVPTVSR
ncbi:hypothetical protein N9B31_05125 [Mariniblastus sp.]|nr:hypothetical protein [Mariniblastus sp.]MDA7905930.1 hypothetical protein [Mariniblastus sp.]MDA7926133.1 hypothetical protein [Mariniblastus sp.]MDB4379838.1 hypothetical protein [Mariniblastus sp.]